MPWRLNARIASRAQRNMPVRFTSITPCHCCQRHLIYFCIQLYGGVGNANIEPAEGLEHAIEHGLYFVFAGDVGLEDDRFPAVFLDDRSCLPGSLLHPSCNSPGHRRPLAQTRSPWPGQAPCSLPSPKPFVPPAPGVWGPAAFHLEVCIRFRSSLVSFQDFVPTAYGW